MTKKSVKRKKPLKAFKLLRALRRLYSPSVRYIQCTNRMCTSNRVQHSTKAIIYNKVSRMLNTKVMDRTFYWSILKIQSFFDVVKAEYPLIVKSSFDKVVKKYEHKLPTTYISKSELYPLYSLYIKE